MLFFHLPPLRCLFVETFNKGKETTEGAANAEKKAAEEKLLKRLSSHKSQDNLAVDEDADKVSVTWRPGLRVVVYCRCFDSFCITL